MGIQDSGPDRLPGKGEPSTPAEIARVQSALGKRLPPGGSNGSGQGGGKGK